jgi:hypothetical protein
MTLRPTGPGAALAATALLAAALSTESLRPADRRPLGPTAVDGARAPLPRRACRLVFAPLAICGRDRWFVAATAICALGYSTARLAAGRVCHSVPTSSSTCSIMHATTTVCLF